MGDKVRKAFEAKYEVPDYLRWQDMEEEYSLINEYSENIDYKKASDRFNDLWVAFLEGFDDGQENFLRKVGAMRERIDFLEEDYHLLASQMVYNGNSVQHWEKKARAYKECAGVVYELKRIFGVESPDEVLDKVKELADG